MGAGVECARSNASARARLLATIGAGFVLALVVAGPARMAGAAAADDDGPQPVTVRILPTALEPAMVQIEPGATVTWVNQAGATRTIMASDASFDSGALQPGERFQFAFTEPRTVTYSVTQAPGIQGSITVAAGGQPASPEVSATGDPFGQSGQSGQSGGTPTDPNAQPNGFAYTGSSTAVNGLIGGTLVALGAVLLSSLRQYGVAGTIARLRFAPRADDLLPSRRHRRERRDLARRRLSR